MTLLRYGGNWEKFHVVDELLRPIFLMVEDACFCKFLFLSSRWTVFYRLDLALSEHCLIPKHLLCREKMVVALLEGGASPVSSSDPTHKKPRGETAADLASANGHGGIAAFLAEKSLTDRLSGLTLGEKGTIINEIDKMSAELDSEKAVAQLVRRTSIVRSVRQIEDQERLHTSLEAVRSSTHAAALIESAFRQQSLRRRAQLDQGFDEYGLSSAEMHNYVAARKIQMAFRGHHQKRQHLAATRIQQKFRGWKGRKEFVTIRQRIIKLQVFYYHPLCLFVQ